MAKVSVGRCKRLNDFTRKQKPRRYTNAKNCTRNRGVEKSKGVAGGGSIVKMMGAASIVKVTGGSKAGGKNIWGSCTSRKLAKVQRSVHKKKTMLPLGTWNLLAIVMQFFAIRGEKRKKERKCRKVG